MCSTSPTRGAFWNGLLATGSKRCSRLRCASGEQGKVLGLKWGDIDFAGGRLNVNGAMKRVEGKQDQAEASNRTIALPAVILASLPKHRAIQQQEREWAGDRWKETSSVFTTTIGTPIERRHLLRDWYRIMKASGLPSIRFHDLRHSATTILFAPARDGNPRTVMEIPSHSDLNNPCKLLRDLVGASGFEPPASWSRTRRSTRLSHAPTAGGKYRASLASRAPLRAAHPGRQLPL
jgi:integrase